MVERADGWRLLIAPNDAVRQVIETTYVFDEVRIEPVEVSDVAAPTGMPGWRVRTGSLELDLEVGTRPLLGRLLRLVPRPVATSRGWATLIDPIAGRVVAGVHTRGAARAGRREWYGATDLHGVVAARGRFDGADLGSVAPVDPPCRFGFSSTPRSPSVTSVVTTVDQT